MQEQISLQNCHSRLSSHPVKKIHIIKEFLKFSGQKCIFVSEKFECLMLMVVAKVDKRIDDIVRISQNT